MKAFAAPRMGSGLQSCSAVEIDPPRWGPDQVSVIFRAGAVNSADIGTVKGTWGVGFVHGKSSPHIVGYDFSGVVEAVGERVSDLRVGDEVFGFLPYSRRNRSGSFAEKIVVSEGDFAIKPPGVSHVDAACIATAGVTALQALRDKARLQPGQRVLVHGASGGVGSFAVQVAKALGAMVIGTASRAKLDFVRTLGADEVIDYRETALADAPGPFDVLFDSVGAASFGDCKAVLKPRGAYVTLVPSLAFVAGRLSSVLSSQVYAFITLKSSPADLKQLATWLVAGDVRSHVHATFALEDAAQALEMQTSGKVRGKIALTL